VAKLLEKIHIDFTKSRPRRSNDNGLVESKNGSVVQKLYDYMHISQQYAADFTVLNSEQVYRYVNFHRPCYFPSIITDSKGKEKTNTISDTPILTITATVLRFKSKPTRPFSE
jgi:hypothetical protein